MFAIIDLLTFYFEGKFCIPGLLNLVQPSSDTVSPLHAKMLSPKTATQEKKYELP